MKYSPSRAAVGLVIVVAGCSGNVEGGIARSGPDVGSGGAQASGNGGAQASENGGSPGATDAGPAPSPELPFPGFISASCHLERFTVATIAAVVHAPVRFTKLATRQDQDGRETTLVFGEAPSIGRTFVVTAVLGYGDTSFTVTLDGPGVDAGIRLPVDAGADARPGPSGALAPDSGTPPCESPTSCEGVPGDDPICRWIGIPRYGVTKSGRLAFARTNGDGSRSCKLATEPLGFPIGEGTYSCGISTNALVLTASALYATCFCGID